MASKQPPSIGRIVHYVSTSSTTPVDTGEVDEKNKPIIKRDPRIKAAMILDVNDDGTVKLRVFTFGEPDQDKNLIAHDDDDARAPGVWFWPPHVAPKEHAPKAPAKEKADKAASKEKEKTA